MQNELGITAGAESHVAEAEYRRIETCLEHARELVVQTKILAAEEREYFGLLSKYHNLDSHISSKTQILEQPGKCHATLVNYSVNGNGNNLIISIPKPIPHIQPTQDQNL
jgi:hypothetical protein